jgi:N-acetyl-alpha-D-muramate 1-phosphate uridylyltransferase
MPAGNDSVTDGDESSEAYETPHPIMPKRAMILAAGFGKRMMPLTDKLPKPLIEVGGRSMLDRNIDRLRDEQIETIVINTHYLGDLIEQHVHRRKKPPEIIVSHENIILETGGGVAKALPALGKDIFFVVNADSLWLNGPTSALQRMVGLWDDEKMDGMLLLHSTVDSYGYSGMGDFCIDPAGVIENRPEREISPFVFTGIQILHPRLFAEAPAGAFPLTVLYNRAIENGRLYGVVHDGEWFHIGSPDGLAEAESYMRERYPETKHR